MKRTAVESSQSAPVLWAQRLGYLLEHVGAKNRAVLLKEHVRQPARYYTKLLPGADTVGALQSKDWRLLVNKSVDAAG